MIYMNFYNYHMIIWSPQPSQHALHEKGLVLNCFHTKKHRNSLIWHTWTHMVPKVFFLSPSTFSHHLTHHQIWSYSISIPQTLVPPAGTTASGHSCILLQRIGILHNSIQLLKGWSYTQKAEKKKKPNA